MRMRVLPLMAVLISFMSGCAVGQGSGTSSGDATGPMVGDATGLGGAAGTAAPWQVLDLETGAIAPATAVAGYATAAAYRDRLLVFRLCDLGRATLGQAATLGRQEGEDPATATLAPFHIGVFEVTRSQWRRLAGDQPWLDLSPAPAAGSDDLPATGMSLERVRTVLAAWNAVHSVRLVLPSEAQWEMAVRAGSTTVFPWGGSTDAQTADANALTWDAGQPAGPAPVGGRLANALGLFDGCGNAWELTAEGTIRGGSWADALILARPANRAAIEADVGHASVGLRLVYRP